MSAALMSGPAFFEFGNIQKDGRIVDGKLIWRDESNSPTPTVVSDTSSFVSDDSSTGSSSVGRSPSSPLMAVGQPISTQPFVAGAAAASIMTNFLLGSASGNNNRGNSNGNINVIFNVGNSAGGNNHRKLNRSQSEPGSTAAAVKNKGCSSSNASRYKTELCHPFEENGSCKYGDKCQFAHGVHELRNLARHPKYKTELCRTFHAEGYCPYGTRCHFIHDEARYSKPKPRPLCLFPGQQLMSSNGQDSALSPNFQNLSPMSSAISNSSPAFPFGSPLRSLYTPPSSPSSIDGRLPVFDRLSSSSPPVLTPFPHHFGGLTA